MNKIERSTSPNQIIEQVKDEKAPLDLTFIVNEPGKTLKDRFNQLIKDCKFFDCLSAFFM